MSRLFAAFLLIVVLAIGGGAIATTAYQAGLTTAVAQVPAGSATVVTPIVVPAYAYGFHPGFGILGLTSSSTSRPTCSTPQWKPTGHRSRG